MDALCVKCGRDLFITRACVRDAYLTGKITKHIAPGNLNPSASIYLFLFKQRNPSENLVNIYYIHIFFLYICITFLHTLCIHNVQATIYVVQSWYLFPNYPIYFRCLKELYYDEHIHLLKAISLTN